MSYLIGAVSSSLRCPRQIPQEPSKLTRETVNSRLGIEVYTFSEMPGRMELLRKLPFPFVDKTPGSVG